MAHDADVAHAVTLGFVLAHTRSLFWQSLKPIFNRKPRHPEKLARVCRHQDGLGGKGVRGNQHIVRPNRRAGSFKMKTQLRVFVVSRGLEWADIYRCKDGFHLRREL